MFISDASSARDKYQSKVRSNQSQMYLISTVSSVQSFRIGPMIDMGGIYMIFVIKLA